MRSFIICLLALCCASTPAPAQTNLSKEDRPVYRRFDSLMKVTVAAHPDDDLPRQLSLAYEALNRRPNPLLLPLDTIAYNARMNTAQLLSGIAFAYVWQGMYDSLGFHSVLQDVLPAVDVYNSYLCGCADFNTLATPREEYGTGMRKRLDSCRTGVHAWSGWAGYKRLADSVGIARLRSKPQQAYMAYLLKTCNSFQRVVIFGLPYFTGNSSQEQFVVRLNGFHARMADAVVSVNAQPAVPYADAPVIKSLQSYLATIGSTFKGRQVQLRMAFYNDTGKFFFLAPVNGRMQVYSMLSYSFANEAGGFRIHNLQYRLRKALPERDTRDEDIFRHMFPYPLMPLSEYGLPLNGELPVERVMRNTYHEDLKGLDLMPPVD